MKKLWILIPIIAFSCNQKTETVNESTVVEDSATAIVEEVPTEEKVAELKKLPDSVIDNAEPVKEVLRTGVMRQENEREIVRIADSEMLPFSLGEEISGENQELVLKIANYDKPNIVAEIKAEDGMNIRFNQVKYADGTMDGPFGRTLNIPNKGDGEIWLIIGKSNMASGSSVGKFTVSVE